MKNKYLALSFFVILIYVVSCAPAQKEPSPTTSTGTGAKQTTQQSTIQSQTSISPEVNDLLTKYKTKLTSISYKYKGPQTGDNFYDFYVKGNKTKYIPWLAIKTLDRQDSYDTIFIDKTAKTAQSYCLAAYCKYGWKKADLNYDDAYIKTIFDWLGGITEAKKVGEEIIDDRSTWKIETNNGILWVDTFYGVPLKIDSFGKSYRFQQTSSNSVTDADVTPS